MQLLRGTRKIKKNTITSILDIEFENGYQLCVFKGSLSPNDIIVKYCTKNSRLRTPKHIHWVIDILLKEQKNSKEVKEFIYRAIEFWDKNIYLEKLEFDYLEEIINDSMKFMYDKNLFKLENGEYPQDFLTVLMILLIIQEKTNNRDAILFRKILAEILKNELDIFKIVGTATLSKRK